MKSIKHILGVIFIVAIFLFSCEKKRDEDHNQIQADTIFNPVIVNGQISIPGEPISYNSLTINTGVLSSVASNSDGSFSSTVNEGATQLIYAKMSDGNPCLLSILINPQENSKTEISPFTTAKALIFLNPAAITADPGLSHTIMTIIESLPETELLTDIINQKINIDPDYLMIEDNDIKVALTNAISKLIETIDAFNNDGNTKIGNNVNRFKELKHFKNDILNNNKTNVTSTTTVGDLLISPSDTLSGVSVSAEQIDQYNYKISVTNYKKRFIGAYLDDADTEIALANALLQSRKNLLSFEPLSPFTKSLSNNLNLNIYPSSKLYIYGLGANDFDALMNAPDWFNRILYPAVFTCVSDYLTPLLQIVTGISHFKMIGDWDNLSGVYEQIINDVCSDNILTVNLATQISVGDYTGVITSVLLRCIRSIIENPSYILSWLQEQGCDLLISAGSAAILPLRIFFIVTSGFELSAAIYDFATSSFVVMYSLNKFVETQKPTVTTSLVDKITSESAIVGGNVTSDGGTPVIERGVFWSTFQNPESTGFKLQIGSGTGEFSTNLSDLTPNTKYFIKAYAENSVGISYGNEVNFNTLGIAPVSNFSASTTNIYEGQIVNFTDQSTNNPTSWYWDFGDNGTSTQQNPSHEYSDPGIYTVSLTTSNSCGSNTETKNDYIHVSSIDGTITDIDGNIYHIVKIGNQWWMAENLKTTRYSDGTSVPLVESTNGWSALTYIDKAYCFYNNSSSNAYTYGALYTWAAAMNGAESSDFNPSGVQGVCPTGWHLPSDEEWKQLEMFLGMSQVQADIGEVWERGTDEGGKLKEIGLIHWNSPNTGATNSSGFTALPGGYRSDGENGGEFHALGERANFWSTTNYNVNSHAWYRELMNIYNNVYRGIYCKKAHGFSVRCLKDD